jgi:beta-phosphoglucomutase-like phosphatase (HAD superfamily)
VVFEDALAGVAAGRAGDFGFVVGVDRVGQTEELRARGADVVVTDLAQLLEDQPAERRA